jgi:hypothetical protein
MSPFGRISRFRLLALLTCLLFFTGLLEALVHQATVSHGYCSDHGQLIHLSADPLTVPPHSQRAQGLHRDRHLSGAHGCPALDFLSSCWSVAVNYTTAALRGVRTHRRRSSGVPLARAIPILRQAPKSSPPGC